LVARCLIGSLAHRAARCSIHFVTFIVTMKMAHGNDKRLKH
jgi:hypothetical protein